MKSGINADAVHFNLHFQHAGAADDTAFTNLNSYIHNFLCTIPTGGTNQISYYLGDELDGTTNAASCSFYLMPTDGSRTGPPASRKFFTMSPIGNDTMPEEVAAVLSFEGDQTGIAEFGVGTRPRSSHRNRIYLGPLASRSWTQDATTKRNYIGTGLIGDATKAAKKLYADAFAGSWNWMVVSRKLVANFPVYFTSMDNAWDTQRRRGGKAQARTWISIT